MELDERLRAKLIGTLRTELPKIGLTEKGRLNIQALFQTDTAFKKVLRGAPNRIKEQIETYLGDAPFVSLMGGVLSDELGQVPAEAKSKAGQLCEIPQYSNVEALAERLVDLLATLPRSYVAVVELPSEFSDVLFEAKSQPIVGQQMTVIGSWHGKQEGYPEPPPTTSIQPHASGLLGLFSRTLENNSQESTLDTSPTKRNCHLYIRLDGYFHDVYSNAPLDRFTSLFKSFFGLALGLEIVEKSWEGSRHDRLTVDVFEQTSAGFTKLEENLIAETAGRLARSLVVTKRGHSHLERDLRNILNVMDMEDAFPQLALAGRWLFDSYANSDDLMSFMQLAICVEVLIGTEDGGEGITTLLANRCAYLIAKSSKERDDLIVEFKNIYKVRSKIVHRGLGTLKMNERNQYRRLRTITNRIVQEEVALSISPEQQHTRPIPMAEAQYKLAK